MIPSMNFRNKVPASIVLVGLFMTNPVQACFKSQYIVYCVKSVDRPDDREIILDERICSSDDYRHRNGENLVGEKQYRDLIDRGRAIFESRPEFEACYIERGLVQK